MTDEPPEALSPSSPKLSPNDASLPPRVVQSEELLAGRREVLIRHGDSLYRLRLTAQGRLILTK